MSSENATNERLRDEITELNNDIQDECMARAKATQPRTSEEALECAMGAAGSVIYSTACVQKVSGYEHIDVHVREFLEEVDAKLTAAAVDILRASVYLDGGTFAERDPEQGSTDEPAYAGADKMLARALEEERELGMGSTDMADVMSLGGPAHSAAESLARMHVTFEHVMNDPDTTEENREALKAMNAKVRTMIAEIYALCPSYYSTATTNAESDGDAR